MCLKDYIGCGLVERNEEGEGTRKIVNNEQDLKLNDEKVTGSNIKFGWELNSNYLRSERLSLFFHYSLHS